MGDLTEDSKVRLALTDRYEKNWWRSKKFISFLILEMILVAMAVVAILASRGHVQELELVGREAEVFGWPLATFLIAVIVTIGVVGMIFNGYQAQVDKYVRAISLGASLPEAGRRKLLFKREELER